MNNEFFNQLKLGEGKLIVLHFPDINIPFSDQIFELTKYFFHIKP